MLFKIKITEQYSTGEPTESWVLPYTYDNIQSAIEFADKLVKETHASESGVITIRFSIQGERGEILFTSRPYYG